MWILTHATSPQKVIKLVLGRIRLIDFGLAHLVPQSGRIHSFSGTPMYLG
jgi:hypothetical protein